MSPQKDWFGDHSTLYLQHYETVHFDLAGLALAYVPRLRWDLWSCYQWHHACSSVARRRGWSLPARCAGAESWILSRTTTAAGSRRGDLQLPHWESPKSHLWRKRHIHNHELTTWMDSLIKFLIIENWMFLLLFAHTERGLFIKTWLQISLMKL